jgi:FkbM family methyltransferase
MALKAHLKRTLEHWPALYAGLLRLRAYLHPTAGEPELRLLPRLCPGDEIAIDVGANHGDYTAILVGLARDVIAVEPNPDIVRVLEARLGDEIRRQRLQLVQGALGAEAGTARLFVPDAGSGLASLDAPPIATAGKAIEVSVRRLDDLVGGRRVGFIKIDVEGYEVAVLRGGMGIISESRPTLLIEIEERHRKGALEEVWFAEASGLSRLLSPFGALRAGRKLRFGTAAECRGARCRRRVPSSRLHLHQQFHIRGASRRAQRPRVS